MKYLPDFENDIFISYAHRDNEPLLEGQKGWVDSFHSVLEKRLRQLLGAETSVWRDFRLQGNERFSDTLEEQVPKVAILVSITSPSYINSEWCNREIKLFHNSMNQTKGIKLGNKSRIFRVEKTFVPFEKYPVEIQGMSGYQFFYPAPDGRYLELNLEFASREDQVKYLMVLEDIAFHITDLLQNLKTQKDAAQSPTINTGPTIYLAETTSDLQEQRQNILRDLTQRGFVVLPDRDLPQNAPELIRVVREYIDRSVLSIHLVGSKYGLVPEDADRSIVCLQHEIASETKPEHVLSRLIWIPQGVAMKVTEGRQKEFIEYLQINPKAQSGAELVEEPLEAFKTIIHDTLDKLEKLSNKPSEQNIKEEEEAPARIYLVCDKAEYAACAPLKNYLFDQGFEVVRPLREGDEAMVRQDHIENLLSCDAVLIFYGKTIDPEEDRWLREKLNDLRKIRGYGRDRAIAAKAVYLTLPETEEKRDFRTREALVIRDFTQSFDPALKEFIEQMKSSINAKE